MKNISSLFTKKIIKKNALLGSVLTFAFVGFSANAAPKYSSGEPIFFLGPIGQSLGGAVYSMMLPHDSLFVNPSAGSFTTEYDASGTFSTAARTLGSSVFDTKSTGYGGGFTYLHRDVDNSDTTKPLKAGGIPQTYQNFALSIFGKLHESFAIGVTGKYSMRSRTGATDLNGKAWNGDVGATFRVSDKVGLGVVYKNIFGDQTNIDSTMIGGGAHIELVPGFTVTGALEKYSNSGTLPAYGVPDPNQIAWSIGGQFSHSSGISVRAAFKDSAPWNSQIAFAGFGYKAEGFHVDYSLATVTKGEKFVVHTFGLGATF